MPKDTHIWFTGTRETPTPQEIQCPFCKRLISMTVISSHAMENGEIHPEISARQVLEKLRGIIDDLIAPGNWESIDPLRPIHHYIHEIETFIADETNISKIVNMQLESEHGGGP